ncbi:MAG: Ribosome-recycling factor [Microgenomates group bacterium GW2011_GWE1_47_12]|uniref:Ribosome-recycling factor n=2 Tax=Candidatus Collieribacteriota TaxID=1752725 RepID=A0A1F5FZJ5_9BACT|nr:MAG: Ribosome-recycling factor [Microgenomates group bacterium GW2011_GWF1_46_12]KKU28098.1 MAG: Ribosome-recycling factor [Microgenomates group bacterium GW2011_GWF2_46_18]KKU43953.1 MAG: Ribosome-recycling factor [Microgenomates group bacterium GW2011_GWA1_46_7]KKU45763.1 MAG: Ribosome-recycling factor [Microgenomates group bacterium GW2011_GWB1_46_7]KKU60510.1 MAG: Ribosome-recycling factor [Microgenomates group bacterium GW2011_GWE1_47_12]KKU62865.1 MAG: Ribosome-recycling factor [Micro
MSEAILAKLQSRLAQAVEVVKKDLGTVRTGRAKPSIVEEVKVEAYGTIMNLQELASISAPDTSLIVVSPWDRGLISAVAAGINKAGLNLNAMVDGETVKIAIPALSQERREELVKLVHQKVEGGKVIGRTIRGEIKEEIEAQEGESGISEDSIKSWLETMQKQIDKFMLELEELGKEKEKELMTL